MPQILLHLSIFLMICYTIYILILYRGLERAKIKSSHYGTDVPSVSVIVAARNESNNILRCLHALLDQDYPQSQFEVIVVDDSSTDCTLEKLLKFAKRSSIIVLQNLGQEKYQSSKKSALETAILKSKGEILLFTDADCSPPATWIKSVVQKFDLSTGLIAGFSPQQSEKKRLDNLLLIDAAAAALVSAATIGYGRGTTCAGRNLAYRKQAWLDVGGFAALPDSLSGDDDFILQAISKHPQWDVKYTLDPNAVVPANGPQSVRTFLRQKQRHISAGKQYPIAAQVGFAVFHFINLMIWLIAFGGIFSNPIFVLPLVFKVVIDFLILKKFLNLLNIKIDFNVVPAWQVLFVYYNTFTGPLSFLKKVTW